VLAVCVSIVLIGTVVVAGGALNAGGTRAFGAAGSSRLVLREDRASAARDAVEPAVSPSAWLTRSGTAPARLTISLASVTATGSSGPALTFAPRDSAPASAVTGPGPAWISAPRVGETAVAAVPGTLPATPSVPTSLPDDQSIIVGVPLPRDDGGSPLAHSSSLSAAPAALDEQAREVDLARPLTPPVSSVIGTPFQQHITPPALILASALADPLQAQQAPSASVYGGPPLDRSTLTGNWGGARDDLAAQGIIVTPSVTLFYQGATAGNTDHDFVFGGKAEIFLTLDLAKLGLWSGFSMKVHAEYNFGQTPGLVGGTTIPNNVAMTVPYLNEAGGDLTNVSFTQRFGSNFTLTAGKMNMFDFYAAGHKFSGGRGIEEFWNTAFVGPPSGIVPVAAFGAIGSLRISPLTYTLMVYDPNDALNRTGFEDPFGAGVTVRGSVDVSSTLFGLPRTDSVAAAVSSEWGTDYTTLPNLGKFANIPGFANSLVHAFITEGMWGNDAEAFLPSQLQQSPPSEKQGRYWLGYSFEQTLWQSAADPTKAWGAFGQVGLSDGNPTLYQWSALGGVGGTGLFPGRPNDKFGVGVFYYSYSSELAQALAPLVTLGNEYGVELFYNVAITKWFWVTADLQVIAPAITAQVNAPSLITATVVDNSTVVLLGLRGQVTF